MGSRLAQRLSTLNAIEKRLKKGKADFFLSRVFLKNVEKK